MKYLLLIICTTFYVSAIAQTTLTVSISADTIGMEDAVKVTYKLFGAQGRIEVLPWEGLQQVAGPNVSSSFSFMNGVNSQEYSESYILVPTQEGSIYIPSAIVDGEPIETEPIELFVMPVPSYPSKGKSKFQKKTIGKAAQKKDPKAEEEEYQRLLKKKKLAKKKKKF